MRYLITTGLLIVATVLFGQLVSGFNGNAATENGCIDCVPLSASSSSKNNQQQTGSNTGTAAAGVLFTESGIPVRLVAADKVSKSLIPVSFSKVFNSVGQQVSPGDRVVVSVFDQREPSASPPAPSITAPASVSSDPAPLAQSVTGTSTDPAASTAASAPKLYSVASSELSKVPNAAAADAEPDDAGKPTSASETEVIAANGTGASQATVSQADPQVPEKEVTNSRMARLKKISLYAVPAGIAVAALSRSNRKEPVEPNSAGKQFSKSLLVNTASNNETTPTDPGDGGTGTTGTEDPAASGDGNVSATDLLLSGQIDEVEDDLKTLTGTVDDLNTEVTGVKSDVNALEGQVSAVQTQLGDNDVGALATQLNDLESKTYAGIASAASLVTAIPSEPGKTILNVGSGYYEGETAIGVSLSRRLSTVNGYFYSGVASGISDVKSPLIRAGIGIEF